MNALRLLCLNLLVMISALADEPAPVSIGQGKLTGVADDGVVSFKGIPYAAPPVRDLRWRPPQSAPSWRGILKAENFGPVCPQLLTAGYSLEVLGDLPMDEDCLHLNVFRPADSPSESLPVMVWILPGGFQQGDAAMPRYEGSALARQGVVVVTFNYRLGMLGQFAHPALSELQSDEPLGNYHLMDQIAALEWVRDNIAAFGGNPNNVTIFGMSAGGVSVNYHMASPASRGLFHRAISQSSGIRVSNPRMLAQDLDGVPSLETEGATIAERLGIDAGGPELVGAMRGLSVADILEYQRNNMLGAGGSLNPVLDGKIVVEAVGAAFREGRQHPVPYITGATSWEGSLLGWAETADPVLQLLRLSRDEANSLYGQADDKLLNNKLYVDLFFGSQRYLAMHHSNQGHPTFVYLFSRILDAHEEDYYGAAHGAETRYVFQTLDSLKLLGGPGLFGDTIGESDYEYARMLGRYWVQFAKTGNPNGEGRPGWPRRTAADDLLLEFGQTEPRVRRDYRERRQRFWDNHFDAGKL